MVVFVEKNWVVFVVFVFLIFCICSIWREPWWYMWNKHLVVFVFFMCSIWRERWWYLWDKHCVVFVVCVFFCIFSIWREPRWYLWNKHWVVNYSPPAHLLLTRNRANIGKDRPVNRAKWIFQQRKHQILAFSCWTSWSKKSTTNIPTAATTRKLLYTILTNMFMR